MPVSKINQDGSVRIFNSKTGQVIDNVKPEELVNYSPSLVGDYEKMRADNEAKVLEAAAKPEAVAAKKNRTLGESGLRTLEQAKEIYEKDPNVLLKQKIPGQWLSRDFDNAMFNTIETILRLRTGAAAPESEVRRYMSKAGINFGDSPEVVEQKLQNLEADLAANAGVDIESPIDVELDKKPDRQGKGNPINDAIQDNPVLDFLLGVAGNTAQDIGAGVRNIQSQGSLEELEKQAKAWEDEAYATDDPKKRSILLKNANQIRSQISGEAKDISGSFTDEVDMNPLLRSVLSATEIAGVAGIASNPKAAVTAPIKTVQNLVSKGGGGAQLLDSIIRGSATKNKLVSMTDEAVEAATKEGKSVHWDDLSKKIREDVLKKYGDTPEVREALNKALIDKTPAGIESVPETMRLNPKELLDWRRQISARGSGKNWVQKALQGDDLGDKVSTDVRRIVSDSVHEMAPGSKQSDTLYSLFKKIGFPEDQIRRAIAIYGLRQVGGPILGDILRSTMRDQ